MKGDEKRITCRPWDPTANGMFSLLCRVRVTVMSSVSADGLGKRRGKGTQLTCNVDRGSLIIRQRKKDEVQNTCTLRVQRTQTKSCHGYMLVQRKMSVSVPLMGVTECENGNKTCNKMKTDESY